METNTNKCFINTLPKNKLGKNYNDFELANMKAKVFLKKNIYGIDVLPQLRHWFSDLKQPSEKQVRNAMLLIIDEDYAIKCGGESNSDNMFSSSLKWMQAHPKTGLDTEPVIYKKWSTNFKDVLITFEEIEELWNSTITQQEKDEEAEDSVLACIKKLHRNYRMNKHSNQSDGFNTESTLSYLERPENKKYILKCFDILYDYRKKEYDWFIETNNGILGDDLNTVCPIKTKKYIDDMKKDIEIYDLVKTLIIK